MRVLRERQFCRGPGVGSLRESAAIAIDQRAERARRMTAGAEGARAAARSHRRLRALLVAYRGRATRVRDTASRSAAIPQR
ncbi:hypothetical protein WS83_24130 [Burkholderia sp. MSMB2042]|nr:hypothetical protein WS78_19115 [Burkholderia savannae]KVG48925.1 hypothetical protein WS77_04230 [Burkholderia sp. MSMB0265]KVG86386.1 hypothetical protein WS81_30895 [Burkholderia sp. MSMB2040]KVG90663.1 hypothetical protein WS82_18365 [Burkholderia sp. MSMB2041]KVH00317.1 hypothetical protein WS83_24130 [Burkholderia sp. MSMB2042]